jgi:hypothetical protein
MMHHKGTSHLGLPPPAQWNLYDADRVVGWTRENAVGFLGFADQTEAVHAAWVAYRALSRRLARDHGTRPVPIDSTSLSVQSTSDGALILSGARAIATLVRPGDDRLAGSDTFGFEVEIPEPADELRVRAMAHLMYRTLRKSGLRWALWRKERPKAARRATVNVRQPVTHPSPRSRRSAPAWAWPAVVLGSVSLLLLALIVPPGIGAALTVTGLAALGVSRVGALPGRRVPRVLAAKPIDGSDADPWDDYRNAGSWG